VGRSSLCGTPREGLAGDNSAGEGLFAKCEIAPGELVAYYNGVRVPHSKVNKRPWRLNDNCISLDADCAIDVPLDFASTDTYRATVGHKANHSFEPNAKYVQVFHPRFGHIKGIRAVRAIRPREEVLVDYGYTSQMPKWYREILVSQKHERRPAGKRGRESSQASSKRAKKQN
jgi:histone-lysine N-methyltransferase SETD7